MWGPRDIKQDLDTAATEAKLERARLAVIYCDYVMNGTTAYRNHLFDIHGITWSSIVDAQKTKDETPAVIIRRTGTHRAPKQLSNTNKAIQL